MNNGFSDVSSGLSNVDPLFPGFLLKIDLTARMGVQEADFAIKKARIEDDEAGIDVGVN